MTDTSSNLLPITIIPRKRIEDSRGCFLKVIDGNEANNPFPCEVYITTAKAGEAKGGHFHNIANEWFTLIKGTALLTIIDVNTLEKTEITLTDTDSKTIYVAPQQAHIFSNVGSDDFILLAYTDEKYNPIDTIPYKF